MRNTSIRSKLFACFGFVALAATASAVYSVTTIRHLRSQMHEEIVGSAARLDQARQVTLGITNMRMAMRGISVFSMMHAQEPFNKARAAFGDAAADVRKTVQEMASGNIGAEERASVNAIRSALDPWVANFQEFADMSAAGRGEQDSQMILKTTSPLMDAAQPGGKAPARGCRSWRETTSPGRHGFRQIRFSAGTGLQGVLDHRRGLLAHKAGLSVDRSL